MRVSKIKVFIQSYRAVSNQKQDFGSGTVLSVLGKMIERDA